ncbi:MAG: hypothetical protein ABIK44_03200 [candidate division WOR-3 bacterium]
MEMPGIPESSSSEELPIYRRPILLIPLVLVMLATLAFAVLVVVRNVHRVTVGPSPVPHYDIPEEISLERFRNKIGILFRKLDVRYEKNRQLVTTFTPELDSFAKICDSGFSHIGHLIAVFDSLEDLRQKRALSDTIKRAYSKLRENVNQFVKKVESAAPEPSLDSLDREFEELQGD